jgi:hypothetical protein
VAARAHGHDVSDLNTCDNLNGLAVCKIHPAIRAAYGHDEVLGCIARYYVNFLYCPCSPCEDADDDFAILETEDLELHAVMLTPKTATVADNHNPWRMFIPQEVHPLFAGRPEPIEYATAAVFTVCRRHASHPDVLRRVRKAVMAAPAKVFEPSTRRPVRADAPFLIDVAVTPELESLPRV